MKALLAAYSIKPETTRGIKKVTAFRSVTCNACGHSGHRQLTIVGDYRVVRCERCSLIFVNPMPFFAKDGFDSVSDGFYYTADQRDFSTAKISHAKKAFAAQSAEWEQLLPNSSDRTLLDVGCGTGVFVDAAVHQGWHAEGCDIDASLVSLGVNNFGVKLSHIDFLDREYGDAAFDVVLFRYVLEHLPNPFEALEEARRVLKPGGLVQIIVPNEAGAFNRLNLMSGSKKKGRWGTLTPPHHLHAYTPKTLSMVIRRAGLIVQRISSVSPYRFPYALYQGQQGGNLSAAEATMFSVAEKLGFGSAIVAYGQKPACASRRSAA